MMLKSGIFILSILVFFLTFIQGNPHHRYESSTSPTAIFIKPKGSIMRRLNPLKLFFTVVYTPDQNPQYKIEWNLPFLKTMLLESKHVSDDDKALFLMKFSNLDNDYANWSEEQHNQLERFTEKYLNVYQSADSFLPYLDCPAVTHAIIDEMLNDLQPNIDEHKRTRARAKAVERLCISE